MKRYIKSNNYSLGPRQKKQASQLISEYNSLDINESLYTSVTLGRFLDTYFRDCGLVFGKDYTCPPYHEGEIMKLSSKQVDSAL